MDPTIFAAYVEKTRWFGGKGRQFAVTDVRRLGRLGARDPHVDVLLIELTYSDTTSECYQVPLSYYSEPEHRLDHAFIGWWEDPELGWVHAYDAVHDRAAMALWLQAFAATDLETGGLTFHRLPGHDLEIDAVGSLFTGEQSNSSVAFGEDSMLKLFRKITPGPNPDITTHEALTRAGSTHIAHLYGWVECGSTQLGMLQQFLRTATDGWDLALTSVRNLYADDDLAARDAGGDFSGEAGRLGEALREVHELLRTELPIDASLKPRSAVITAGMNARLDAAILVVPELAKHAEILRSSYAALAALPQISVQHVHGDLHLGQTMRTALGWKIVDFEGEPAKPLADRLLPDSPWRDVAGMIRSFDYAPQVVSRELTDRGLEWAARNQRYFLTAYAGGELTAEQQILVNAYVADKAVYEAVYETHNRPTWVDIPLAAIARIGAS